MNSYNLIVKENEYTIELVFNGKKYSQKFLRQSDFMFKKVEGDDFENIKEIPDELWEELENSLGFSIAQAFKEVA